EEAADAPAGGAAGEGGGGAQRPAPGVEERWQEERPGEEGAVGTADLAVRGLQADPEEEVGGEPPGGGDLEAPRRLRGLRRQPSQREPPGEAGAQGGQGGATG